jgi:hypothetical protein
MHLIRSSLHHLIIEVCPKPDNLAAAPVVNILSGFRKTITSHPEARAVRCAVGAAARSDCNSQ